MGMRCWLFGHQARQVGYTGRGYPIRVCDRCQKRENMMTGTYEAVGLIDLHGKSTTVDVDDRGYCLCHHVKVV